MHDVIPLLAAALAGGILGFVLGRLVFPAQRQADAIALAAAEAAVRRSEEEMRAERDRADRLDASLALKTEQLQEEEKRGARLDERAAALEKQAREQMQAATQAVEAQMRAELGAREAAEELARLRERAAAALREAEGARLQAQEGTSRSEAAKAALSEAQEQLARLTERDQALSREVADLRAREGKLQETLKSEFEVIAARVLKANAADMSEASHKQINALLEPLRARLQEFQGKVESTYENEKRDVLALKEQIKLVMETSRDLGSQADGLAKALKGDVQMLGRWGELVLDRVLTAAGLVEGREYITQGRGLGLTDDDGASQKPDVIIKLPEERTMIIDSKVSLANYDRLMAAATEGERQEFSRAFVRDVRAHIDGLSGKRYQDNDQLTAHDCVLMFMPVEGALAAALTADPELFTYGWAKRVVLVGPPTLLMTLRTVGSIWRYENQAQNAQEIARLAGLLTDKVAMSLDDFNRVAKLIYDAGEVHKEAVRRFATGKDNTLRLHERIRSLGVKTRHPGPTVMLDGERITADTETDA